MDNPKFQNVTAGIILAVWIASFFLPAVADAPNSDQIRPGYFAAGLSGLALWIAVTSLFSSDRPDLEMLYLGSFCLANIFMIAAPFALRFARRGRALVFICLMGFWDFLTCSYLLYGRLTKHMNLTRVGWWTWECSVIAMTLLILLVRQTAVSGAMSAMDRS